VTASRASWKGPVASVAAVTMLAMILPATSVLADNPARGQAQEIGSKSAGTSSDLSGPAKAPARKPQRKSGSPSNFVYELINQIQVQSKELCARYGNPADCLEEAEVCLTMRDTDDNQIKLCLNTVPGDSGDKGTVQKSRLRR
jgi:hypothetical protein